MHTFILLLASRLKFYLIFNPFEPLRRSFVFYGGNASGCDQFEMKIIIREGKKEKKKQRNYILEKLKVIFFSKSRSCESHVQIPQILIEFSVQWLKNVEWRKKKQIREERERVRYYIHHETNSLRYFLDRDINHIFWLVLQKKKRIQGCDKLWIFSRLISIWRVMGYRSLWVCRRWNRCE